MSKWINEALEDIEKNKKNYWRDIKIKV
jgi:hypothetical protein